MGLPTVRKFLCCITLETGGLIIGWFNIILSFLALFALISLMSLTIVAYNHEDLNNNNQNFIGAFAVLMTVYAIMILYYAIAFIAAIMLVQGARKRDHTRMMLFMILMAVGVVLQFLQILLAGWSTFVSGLFLACLSAYWFICIYSLYNKIRNEKVGQPYA